MPILSGPVLAISETARATAQGRERVEHERIVWKQRNGVANSRPQSIHTRAGELKFNVVPRGSLRRVRFHRCGPCGENFRRGYVDENGCDVARFGLGSDGV